IDFGELAHRPYRRDELVLAVPRGHPLARRKRLRFEDTLDVEHVGLPPSTAVHTMLNRAALKAGRRISYRVIVSNFDASFRVVAAGLGVSVVPRQVAGLYVSSGQVQIVPLSNDWAQREFAVCWRPGGDVSPAALRLAEFLVHQARPAAPAGA